MRGALGRHQPLAEGAVFAAHAGKAVGQDPRRKSIRNSATTNAGMPAPSARASTVARKFVRCVRTMPRCQVASLI